MVDDFILETWTISTHALREEGDLGGVDDDAIDGISTHALREEGDRTGRRRSVHRYISTHALREEGDTTSLTHRQLYCKISTHALREEGDCSMLSCSIGQDNFYPRPPRGGRPSAAGPGTISSNFYPRPPRGGRLPRLAGG